MVLYKMLPHVTWTCVHVTRFLGELFIKKKHSGHMFDFYYFKYEQRPNKLTRLCHTIKTLFSIKTAEIKVWSMLHVDLYRVWLLLRNWQITRPKMCLKVNLMKDLWTCENPLPSPPCVFSPNSIK